MKNRYVVGVDYGTGVEIDGELWAHTLSEAKEALKRDNNSPKRKIYKLVEVKPRKGGLR